MEKRQRGICVFTAVIFLGIWFWVTPLAWSQSPDAASVLPDDTDFQSSIASFTRVYELVENNYADPLDPDQAIYGTRTSAGAIPGMLRTLDPHSNFFDARAFSSLREQQEGHYYGVGMRIQQRPGKLGKMTVMVYEPMPGSPAFRAGLRPGDVIVAVDGKPTDGMDSTRVASLLKGPKGTTVRVGVAREGSDAPLEFVLTREEISPHSVDDAFEIRPGVAYIHINGFTETTNDELTEELNRLNVRTLKGLILDLRGNPGGLLQEAVDVSDHFLAKNQLIVYHYGRRSREKRYYAAKGDGGREYPIVVLIDRMTASAAEIVTGALQDHDRALVMGEPSFGKGLVQTVYPLSEQTGLALTTARYYTPSGRLIQRDYKDVSLYDYYYLRADGPVPHADMRQTDGGREVYGGGGITPDVRVDPPKSSPAEEMLEGRGAYFSFSKYYLGVHKTIPRDFTINDQVLGEFKAFLAQQAIPLSDADLQANLDEISSHLRVQLVGMIYGQTEADQLRMENDPLVLKALDHLDQAKELVANAKRYVASQAAHDDPPRSQASENK